MFVVYPYAPKDELTLATYLEDLAGVPVDYLEAACERVRKGARGGDPVPTPADLLAEARRVRAERRRAKRAAEREVNEGDVIPLDQAREQLAALEAGPLPESAPERIGRAAVIMGLRRRIEAGERTAVVLRGEGVR